MSYRKPIWSCLLLCILCTGFHATATEYAYAVFFSNKNNTPYSLSSPHTYLSSRALARRSAQGIAVDSSDLPVDPQYLDSVINDTHGVIYETSRWLNLCVVMLHDTTAILSLNGKLFIDSIKLVAVYDTLIAFRKKHCTERTTEADVVYYNKTWTQTAQVQGNCLHDQGFNGEGKLIAVIDAGFYGADLLSGLDSLRADNRVVDMHNFTYDTSFVFGWDSHGTNVLSTMAGYVPDTFVGTAPLASYALYVTEYDPNDQPLEMINMLAATERADSIGADVITESLGYDLFLNPADGMDFSADLDGKTTYAARAANIATMKGMLFVATAGNDGAGFMTWGNHITTPGDADSALTVGAVDATEAIAGFSGYGPNAAGQVKPDICAMGVAAEILNYSGTSSQYAVGYGTSFSTPQVAGWVACLWEAYPHSTPAQLKLAINRSATQYTAPSAQYGYGIPDLCTAMQYLDIPKITDNRSSWITVSPSPFAETMNISIHLSTPGKVGITISDVEGRELFHYLGYFEQGMNTPISISLPGISSGIYILKATTAQTQEVLKLVKE